jgi:hypothetical protein
MTHAEMCGKVHASGRDDADVSKAHVETTHILLIYYLIII